ncbi:MAG: ATP synthase subunit I [Oscillospiraceae bacterium]|nr:ATP synthase subunit I [Oscillospiraceae bacterium]
MTIKKPRDEAVELMLVELKGMVLTLALCNAVVIIICVVLCAVTGDWQWQLATGLALGNVATIGNFIFLGYKSARIIRRKDRRYAQVFSSVMFFVRYFGAFALFGLLIRLDVINPFTVVAPLFYPKIHYTLKAILRKEV